MSAARRRKPAPVRTSTPASASDHERLPRHLNLVRVRLLNSGPNPTVGITMPSSILATCGLNLGDRVYVLVEGEGRLVVEKANRAVTGLRGRDRPDPVLLTPAEKQTIREELEERVRALEVEVVDQERVGNKKAARLRLVQADRLRRVIGKFGGKKMMR